MESETLFTDTIQLKDEDYEKYIANDTIGDRDKKHCHCHKPHSCGCSKDLFESIALVESAIAEILNAESEKLQKSVRLACDIDDLLDINKSVRSTLIHTTFLEQTLFAKLETVCNGCKKDHH